jgi:hypothetical protein
MTKEELDLLEWKHNVLNPLVLKGDLIAKLFSIEERMKLLPQTDIPVRHYFSEGAYAREIDIPQGALIIGKLHKFSQINILSKGVISVLIDHEWKKLTAPYTFASPAGVKRAAYIHEDTTWTTISGTQETDLDKLEEVLTVASYEEYLSLQPPQSITTTVGG